LSFMQADPLNRGGLSEPSLIVDEKANLFAGAGRETADTGYVRRYLAIVVGQRRGNVQIARFDGRVVTE
jgi:hypothetical protein